MSQYDDSGYKAFKAAGAITIYDRVKLSAADTVDVAGLAEIEIGTAQNAAFAANDLVNVKLRTAPGTHKMRMKDTGSAAATVYTEAAGEAQFTATNTAYVIGIALEAATAENDIIEVLYNAHGDTAISGL
jgi:hypothetical protein